MNRINSVFKCGEYQVFRVPTENIFNIYHIDGLKMELMIGNFQRLEDAIKYLLHP